MDTNLAVDLVIRAVDLGIRFIDTAQGYGQSESLIGTALLHTDDPESVVICTKIVLDALPESGIEIEEFLLSKIDVSRKRLGRDRLDVILLHNPDRSVLSEPTKEAFVKLRSRGLIDAYGVSAKTLDDALHIADLRFGNFVEWNYSILERRPQEILLPLLASRNINFVARSPLFRGLITENFLARGPEAKFDDVRQNIDTSALSWVHEALGKLKIHSSQLDMSLSELALAFVCLNDLVQIVIPGIRCPEHLDSILRVKHLDDHERWYIENMDLRVGACFPGYA